MDLARHLSLSELTRDKNTHTANAWMQQTDKNDTLQSQQEQRQAKEDDEWEIKTNTKRNKRTASERKEREIEKKRGTKSIDALHIHRASKRQSTLV